MKKQRLFWVRHQRATSGLYVGQLRGTAITWPNRTRQMGRDFRRREDEEMRVGAPQTDSIEFLEWTEGDRLRHSKFVALRDDKNPREVVKEG